MNTTIEEQMEILKEATNFALLSKENAVKYLQDAGIIKKRVARKTVEARYTKVIDQRKNSNNNQLLNYVTMNTTIEEQIKTNHEAYLIVSQSKESTLKFLQDIGAIKKRKEDTTPTIKLRKRSTTKK